MGRQLHSFQIQSACYHLLNQLDQIRVSLLKDPLNYLPAFDHALKEVVVSVHDPTKHLTVEESIYYVALRGSFGDHHVNPRTLRAAMLGKMVSIEGIVTRCTLFCTTSL